MSNFFVYALLRTTLAAINCFPIAVSTWISRRIGDVGFLALGSRRKVAFRNLDIAFGGSKSSAQKQKIALESFRHFVTSFMEFTRIPRFRKHSKAHFRFSGIEHLKQAFARGKGLILVMSHLGPWEYLAFLAHLKNIPSIILGKRIRNPYIYEWVRRLRLAADLKHTDKTEGARKVLSELKQNHLVAIAIDQWAGNEELWVDFFGRPVSTTSLPARLGKKTSCALVPCYCIRKSCGEYEICIFPEMNIDKQDDNYEKKVTEKLNNFLEEKIRQFPEQWIWTHKRWKGKKEYK